MQTAWLVVRIKREQTHETGRVIEPDRRLASARSFNKNSGIVTGIFLESKTKQSDLFAGHSVE